MLDKSLIGHALKPASIRIEEGAVRFYAQAIGETDPICRDLDAARAAGHPSLRVPPTFLSCLQGMVSSTRDVLTLVGFDIARILHAEQGYTYHHPVFAGDTLTFERSIVDLYEKKGGALQFVVMASKVTDQRGRHVADMRASIVQRQI